MKDEVAFEGLRIDEAKYGLGVYATRSFAAQETVGKVHGSVICDPDHSSEYCIALTDRVSLEPSAPFRFLNHSCEPNCALWQFDVEDDDGEIVGTEVWVETLKPIASGEQLTIDYAWPADGAIPCGCGSPACRGWIVDERQLKDLPAPGPHRPGGSASAA